MAKHSGFKFAIKAITNHSHQRYEAQTSTSEFIDSLLPLKGGQARPVLFQLPPN